MAGLPAELLRTPGGLTTTPQGAPAPGPDLASEARRLAIIDSMYKLGGIDSPLKELIEGKYKDPRYLAEVERQKLAAGAPYKLQEQTNQAVLQQWNDISKSFLDRQKDWAAIGLGLDGKGNLVEMPNARALGLTPKAKEEAAQELAKLQGRIELLKQNKMVDPKTGEIKLVPGAASAEEELKRRETAATEGTKYSFEELKNATESEKAAIRNQARLGPLAEAASKFETGPGEETWTQIKAVAKKAGLIKGEDVPDREIFQQMQTALQVAAAPKGQGATSDYERSLYVKAVPSMAMSPGGLARAIQIANSLDEYDKKVAAIHRQVYKEGGNVPNAVEAQTRIAALGPPLTPDQYAALYSPGGTVAPTAAPNNPAPGQNPYGRRVQ